jgi:hypothetical protein
MLDQTDIKASLLDVKRVLKWGDEATLALCKHDLASGEYETLLIVPDGWNVSEGEETESPMLIEIAERDSVTAELLTKAGVLSFNKQIYAFTANDRTQPAAPSKRIWEFFVNPTGDTHAD